MFTASAQSRACLAAIDRTVVASSEDTAGTPATAGTLSSQSMNDRCC
jgi:hypothetical protein